MTPTSMTGTAGPTTVLVVDEDPNGLRVLAAVLAGAGYRAVVACGADDAWRKLALQSFDLAVVELAMKQTSGIRLIEEMRASPLVRAMPVLAVTTPIRGALARPIGCDGFVFRPIDPARMLESVARACSRGSRPGRMRAEECHGAPGVGAASAATNGSERQGWNEFDELQHGGHEGCREGKE